MHALLKLLCTIAVETRDYYQYGSEHVQSSNGSGIEELNQYSADKFALQLTPNSNTLLHVAAEFGSYHCVPVILSKCPSLLRRANTDGDAPIHVAVARMNSRVVESLVDFTKSEGGGAAAVREMLRARNHDGDMPLHLAARYGISGAILEILSTEEDPGLDHGPNTAGETPLYLLVERGYNVTVLSHMLKTCTPPEYYGSPSGRAAVIRRKGLSENGGDGKYLGNKVAFALSLNCKALRPVWTSSWEVKVEVFKEFDRRICKMDIRPFGINELELQCGATIHNSIGPGIDVH